MEKNNQLTGRHARAFMLLCAMVYFTSYLDAHQLHRTLVCEAHRQRSGSPRARPGTRQRHRPSWPTATGQLVGGLVGDGSISAPAHPWRSGSAADFCLRLSRMSRLRERGRRTAVHASTGRGRAVSARAMFWPPTLVAADAAPENLDGGRAAARALSSGSRSRSSARDDRRAAGGLPRLLRFLSSSRWAARVDPPPESAASS